MIRPVEVCGRVEKHPSIELGDEGTSWSILDIGLKRGAVAYCVGVGTNVSFDLELIRRYSTEVHAFDPTPVSLAWVLKQSFPEQFHFHPVGLADFDGNLEFFPPRDPSHVSHSSVERFGEKVEPIRLPVQRLTTLMRELGHKKLDLLKMDIEGSEYGVIDDLVRENVQIGQLLIEFHHRHPSIGMEKTRKAISTLEAAGFKVFAVRSAGQDYSLFHPDHA